MSERVSFGNEKLSPVLERLRRKTIYEQRDFKSPYQILQRSIVLSRDRDRDPDSFLRETTVLFSSFSRTNKISDIDVNDLIATLFVLRDNPDKTKYRFPDSVKQGEISLLIDSLLGKNLDFLSGKKDSSIVLPAYLILRSLKENHSWWTWTRTFLRKKRDRLQTIELRNRLLDSIHTKKSREMLERRFKQSLDIEEKRFTEIPSPSPKPKPEAQGERQTGLIPKPPQMTIPEGFYSSKFNRIKKFIDDKIEEPENSKDLNLIKNSILMLLKKGQVYISPNGEIVFNHKLLDQIKKAIGEDDILFSKLLIDNKDTRHLTSLAIVSLLSGKTSWMLPAKERSSLLPLTKSFEKSLKTVFSEKNILDGVKGNIQRGLKTSNYTQLDQDVLSILYRNFYQIDKQPNSNDLFNFVQVEGVAESFIALKKLIFLDILKDEVRVNKKNRYLAESYPNFSFNLNNQYKFFLDQLRENKIVLSDAYKLTEKQIVELGCFFGLQNHLRSQKKQYSQKLGDILNDFRLPEISWRGIKLPIRYEKNAMGKMEIQYQEKVLVLYDPNTKI